MIRNYPNKKRLKIFLIGQKSCKNSHFREKIRIRGRFVKIMLGCDTSRITNISSGNIWESTILESPKKCLFFYRAECQE